MANEEQLKILMQGVEVWNKWREENPDVDIDLQKSNLKRIYLPMVNFEGVNLKDTSLNFATLKAANLKGADLKKASLHSCDLRGANFFGANLEYVNLSGTNLCGACLSQANLSKSELNNANLNKAIIDDADLSDAQLYYSDLRETNLQNSILSRAQMFKADLTQADLSKAELLETNMFQANLQRANLSSAELRGSDLSRSILTETNLKGSDLKEVNFVKADLNYSEITGANLYGASRDDWKIDGIICDYVYWDEERKIRTPKNRDFLPGEFEELYKQLPTFDYYFENGFRPIDSVLMSRIVDEINQKNPEFELKLDSFHSRGQPHAKFTVIQKDYIEKASKQVTEGYNAELKALKGRMHDLEDTVKELSARPNSIHYIQKALMGDHMKIIEGNNFENTGGQQVIGNENVVADHRSHVNITQTLSKDSSPEEFIGYLNHLLQELKKQDFPDETKEEIENELKGAQIQAKKPKKDKVKISNRLKNATEILKNAGLTATAAVAFGNMVGKAIEWCGDKWIDMVVK